MSGPERASRTQFERGRPRIACVGLGYVGYNSALEFGRASYPIVGVDTDDGLVDAIRSGNAPFETAQIESVLDNDHDRITTQIAHAADADVYIISVPTPVDSDNAPDLSAVRAAGRDVATVLDSGNLVVLQSTVYPGCTRNELVPELELSGLEAGTHFGVSHVPERYSPGDGPPTRMTRVVGSITEEWRDVTAELYDDIADDTAPVSALEVAEATKLTENIQRDVNIALMNELATAAEQIGIDIWEVIESAGTKWNFQRYEPGLGVGGHCLPVDPYYFREAAKDVGAEMDLLTAAREVNNSMPRHHAEKVQLSLDALGKSTSAAVVAVLGVTYKPGVRDMRNSAAVELIQDLREGTLAVEVFDPQFELDEPIAGTDVSNAESAMDAVRNADVVVVATGHDAFHRLDPTALAAAMNRDPVLVDPQRTFDPAAVAESGLLYPHELGTQFIPDLGATEADGGWPIAGDVGSRGWGE
jgi:UDP-N-acetyl-D-glucosamine/UDP-N-acetyl-D-galactosamine dehydrogenase